MRIIGTLAATGLILSACGSAAGTATTTAITTPPVTTTATAVDGFPVSVEAANGDMTISRRPEAIVSLAPTATEMLAAVGALPQMVAVDDQSNYPDGLPTTDLSGFTPNIEAIASYQPDLVVVSNDIDGMVGALTSLDIPVLLMPAAVTLDDVYTQIEQLGAATGHRAEAARLVAEMAEEIDELVASVSPADPSPTYYHELDPGLFSVTSSTFIGSIYTLVGLVNIADPADIDGFGYPQLSPEFIIEQDPDLIFLADTVCCGENAQTVAQRPGWAELTAVRNGAVVELSDDVASRWGPRVVEFLRVITEGALALQPAS